MLYNKKEIGSDGTSCLFDWHERLQRPAFGGHIVWMGGTGCFSASYLLWFCNRIWSIGIPGGIYGRGVLSGGISGAELRSAECAVTVFDFAGVAVAVSALFGGIAAFLWRGCRDWAGDGAAAESGKKEKRAGRGGTRERKKERI